MMGAPEVMNTEVVHTCGAVFHGLGEDYWRHVDANNCTPYHNPNTRTATELQVGDRDQFGRTITAIRSSKSGRTWWLTIDGTTREMRLGAEDRIYVTAGE